jgi:hypothetical protein
MTQNYQEKHYEDVARILRLRYQYYHSYEARLALESTAQDFADLFAADNPNICCNQPVGIEKVCLSRCPCAKHHPRNGFDRGRFLAVCGIES